MSRSKQLVYWNVPVPKTLDKAVEDAVDHDSHVSKTDLIREAVREKLEKMGVRLTVAQLSEDGRHE
jgi:Arc/MetJ-type ribon-helix-helix transcriptional regulator